MSVLATPSGGELGRGFSGLESSGGVGDFIVATVHEILDVRLHHLTIRVQFLQKNKTGFKKPENLNRDVMQSRCTIWWCFFTKNILVWTAESLP